MNEDILHESGDTRKNFIFDYCEHILYYWQLCDKQHILQKTLSKMSRQTRASSGGVAAETSCVINPRNKQDKEVAKQFRCPI